MEGQMRNDQRHVPADMDRFIPARDEPLLLDSAREERAWQGVLASYLPLPERRPRPASALARSLGCTCWQINGGAMSMRVVIGWKGSLEFNLGWAISPACVAHGSMLEEQRSRGAA